VAFCIRFVTVNSTKESFFLTGSGSNCNENMATYTNSYLYDNARNCRFASASTVCAQRRQPRHYEGEFMFLPGNLFFFY
jgi:hypothetical protein